jgi:sugar-specific transcriptional regulator TrmB
VLGRFGFSPTESRTYEALLRLGASTGYAVARHLGIARANAYQALESLARRGAARKAGGNPTRYVALPPVALLAELERSFRRDLSALEESLRQVTLAVTPAGGGGDLEILTSASDVLDRFVRLADSAKEELLAVTGPWAEGSFEALERAARRGVSIRSLALGEPAPAGMHVRAVSQSDLRAYWSGLPLAAVADRSYAVCGILSGPDSSGIAGVVPGVVVFVRHLLRRELAG